jgi:hypothetical protein
MFPKRPHRPLRACNTYALIHADCLGTTSATMADPDRWIPGATSAPTAKTVDLA